MKTKKNVVYQMLYHFVIAFIPLVISPYLTRTLGSEKLGAYSYTNSIAAFFVMLILLGINDHGCRLIASSNCIEDKKKNFYSLVFARLVLSFVFFILYFIFIFSLGIEYIINFLILLPYVVSAFLDINWFYFGSERFKSVLLRNLVIKILEMSFIFIFIKGENDIYLYTAIMSLSSILGQLFLWPSVIKEIKFYFPKFEEIKSHFKPLFIFSLSSFALHLYLVFDKTLIGLLSPNGLKDVAFYDYSEKLVKLPVGILSSLSVILLSRMTILINENKEKNEIVDNVGKYILFFSFAACGSAFGLSAIGDIFVEIYYGEDFSNCGNFVSLLSLIAIIIPFGTVVRSAYLLPMKKDKEYVVSIVMSALVNLLLNLVLIPVIGVYGAIVGTIMAELLGCFLQCYYSRKDLPIKPYLKTLLIFMVFGLIMFIIIKIINSLLIYEDLTILFIDILVGVIIYSVLSLIYIKIYFRKIYDDLSFTLKKVISMIIKR